VRFLRADARHPVIRRAAALRGRRHRAAARAAISSSRGLLGLQLLDALLPAGHLGIGGVAGGGRARSTASSVRSGSLAQREQRVLLLLVRAVIAVRQLLPRLRRSVWASVMARHLLVM
jgi:hypothetical protein